MNKWKDKFLVAGLSAVIALMTWGLKTVIDLKSGVSVIATQLEERQRAAVVFQARFSVLEQDLKELRSELATHTLAHRR